MKARIFAILVCTAMLITSLSGCRKYFTEPIPVEGADGIKQTESVQEKNNTDKTDEADTDENSSNTDIDGFEIVGFSNSSDKPALEITDNLGEGIRTIYLDDAELAQALYTNCEKILLRAEYDDNSNLTDYSVIDKNTGEDYGKLTAKELNDKFNWQSLYENTDANYTGEIHTSELADGKVYLYTMNGEAEVVIIHDASANMVVYGQDRDYGMEESECFFRSYIGNTTAKTGFIAFEEVYMVHCESFKDEDVVKHLTDEQIIKLGDYKNGDTIATGYAKCIYNNTDKDFTVTFKDGTAKIKAGEVVGFDRMSYNEFKLG